MTEENQETHFQHLKTMYNVPYIHGVSVRVLAAFMLKCA